MRGRFLPNIMPLGNPIKYLVECLRIPHIWPADHQYFSRSHKYDRYDIGFHPEAIQSRSRHSGVLNSEWSHFSGVKIACHSFDPVQRGHLAIQG